jgi:hypothetical protein
MAADLGDPKGPLKGGQAAFVDLRQIWLPEALRLPRRDIVG